MSNLKEAYDAVFRSDGSIKVCGRDACSNLMQECSKIDSTKDYGNRLTGMMNVENIKELCRHQE